MKTIAMTVKAMTLPNIHKIIIMDDRCARAY